MLTFNKIDYLNEEDRAILEQVFSKKIAVAEQAIVELEEKVDSLEGDINRWHLLLGTDKAFIKSYDRSWSRARKVIYIIANPQILGKSSLAGVLDILRALHHLDPELVPSIEKAGLRSSFTRIVSTLAWEGKIKKLRQKQDKRIVHYISLNWFDGDSLKPEYSSLLKTLETIPARKKSPALTRTKEKQKSRS